MQTQRSEGVINTKKGRDGGLELVAHSRAVRLCKYIVHTYMCICKYIRSRLLLLLQMFSISGFAFKESLFKTGQTFSQHMNSKTRIAKEL